MFYKSLFLKPLDISWTVCSFGRNGRLRMTIIRGAIKLNGYQLARGRHITAEPGY